jgi:hypothetical protein
LLYAEFELLCCTQDALTGLPPANGVLSLPSPVVHMIPLCEVEEETAGILCLLRMPAEFSAEKLHKADHY